MSEQEPALWQNIQGKYLIVKSQVQKDQESNTVLTIGSTTDPNVMMNAKFAPLSQKHQTKLSISEEENFWIGSI